MVSFQSTNEPSRLTLLFWVLLAWSKIIKIPDYCKITHQGT